MAPAFVSPSVLKQIRVAHNLNVKRCPPEHHPTPPCRPYRRVTPFFACQESNPPQKPGIIVVDHGSKRKAANDMIFEVAQDVQSKTPNVPVFAAHMELAEPTIADAVELCAEKGLDHVIVVPFFLSPGRHATEDVPQLTREAVNKYPHMSYEVKPPIGKHPSLIDIIRDSAGVA